MKNKIIVCFMASFPYGKKETYFVNELEYLSNSFDVIYIVPIYNPFKDNVKRGVPQNVKVFEPIFKQGNLRLIEGLKSLRWNSLFVKEFFYEKVYSDSFKFKKWLKE